MSTYLEEINKFLPHREPFLFIDEVVEIELGNSRNESTTIALMKSIEGAVLELINIGYDKRFWTYETEK